MRRDSIRLVRQTVAMTVALALASCTEDSSGPMQPIVRGLYTTPTGMVTSNPPAILVGAGDIASCGNNNDEATAKLLDTIAGTVMIIGDNVYENGTTSEYNNCYHPTWGRHKARTKPSAGNHDYNSSGAAPYYNYFGAAAGDPSKGYYSYELGAWHIIVLNSNISSGSGSGQSNWLKADLAAHPNLCTLAYFHHPLYSSTGGSGSGGATYSGVRGMWNDLYAGDADLVIGGHRHFYERLAPMKPDGSADNVRGMREIIAGTGGIGGGTLSNIHPRSEVRNGSTFGVLKLYLYEDSYAWKFIPVAGKTFTDSGSTACHGSGSGGGVSASKSTVSASPTSIAAGGATSTITVTVRDANNNPISGATVVLAATGTGNTLSQPSGTTNSSGVATGTLSSTVAEAKTVSATANGVAITQTATVTVTPPPVSASQSTVTASPTSIIAGSGSSTITVTARDASGNPISGATVVLSATGTGNTLTQPSGPTNGSGVATGTLSSTVAQTKTVSATANGVAITQTAAVTVTSGSGGVSPSLSTVAASPTSIIASSGTSTITVTVRDGSGNPISGATVVLAATGSGNTLTQPSGTTNASGVATGTLSSTAAGSKTVMATANGTAISQTATVTVNAGPVSASQSTVAASPTSILVGSGSATITVTAKDANDNPISGATVVLAATGSGNTLTQPSGTTSASGVATGSLSSTVTGAKTVSATINGVAVTQTATVTVTSEPVSASLSTVAASPTSITAGSGTSTITVTVRNSSGNPISGATVVLAATGSGNTLTQPSGTTNASGVATGTLESTVAESKTVSATANGTAITQTATVTVTAGQVSTSQSTITASPTSITAGSGTSTITVTAKDAYGNPISGATVVLDASGSGNTLTQPSGPTNASGVATGSLSSTVAETKTVHPTINGLLSGQPTTTVTVTPAGSGGTITHTLLTGGHDVNNVKIFTTAAIAPAPNTLVTVAVLTHQSSAAAPSPTLTGGGMATWDIVASVPYNGATPLDRVTIYRAMSAAPGSGPITITSSVTVSNCQWIVSQWSGVDVSGTNGAGAIVQTGSTSGTTVNGLTVTLAAFASANNAAYGVFGIASATPVATAGSGFTTIDQQPSGESTIGDLFAEWAVNRPTVNATWSSKTAGALGVEIKAAP